MNFLVIGSTGQLGRALLAAAPPHAHVMPVNRSDCDLTDRAAIESLIVNAKPDIVINAAAYTAVDMAESEPESSHSINAEAVGDLVAALEQHGGKLIHVSTDFVFDGAGSQPYQPEEARNPLSVYGRTKAEGEDHLRDSDLLVRTSWVYSAGGTNFVRTMLRLMRERDEVRVVADQIGAPTWATSLAEAIWALALQGRTGIWHYTDSGTASWHEFAVAIAEEALELGLLERPVEVIPITTQDYPTPARRPAYSVLDCSATAEALGKQAPHWRENLRTMLKEEQALG